MEVATCLTTTGEDTSLEASSSDLLSSSSSPPESLRPKCQKLFEDIQKCCTVDEFRKVYDTTDFQECITKLQDAPLEIDREVWAEEWAKKLVKRDPDALELSYIKRTVKSLLCRMCDRWKGYSDSPTTVSDIDIINEFCDTRIVKIMSLVVVMDRADALFHLNVANNRRLESWFSVRHVEEFGDIENLSHKLGVTLSKGTIPPLNRRYLDLLDLPQLGLRKNEFLTKWLKPCAAPLRTYTS